MDFEKVESAVITEAKEDADRILAEARKKSEELMVQFREESQLILEEAIHQAEVASARETARRLGLARHKGRLKVLNTKNSVINDIFRKVNEKLRSLDNNKYIITLERWLQSMPPEVCGKIIVSPEDAEIFTLDFLKRINSGRPKQSAFTAFIPDKKINGGFIIEGDTYSVDYTFDNKINELRESIAGDLARDLFES